jgi:hypothetical protein
MLSVLVSTSFLINEIYLGQMIYAKDISKEPNLTPKPADDNKNPAKQSTLTPRPADDNKNRPNQSILILPPNNDCEPQFDCLCKISPTQCPSPPPPSEGDDHKSEKITLKSKEKQGIKQGNSPS